MQIFVTGMDSIRNFPSKTIVINGLENAPKAFIGLFQGNNIGKMLVKI